MWQLAYADFEDRKEACNNIIITSVNLTIQKQVHVIILLLAKKI